MEFSTKVAKKWYFKTQALSPLLLLKGWEVGAAGGVNPIYQTAPPSRLPTPTHTLPNTHTHIHTSPFLLFVSDDLGEAELNQIIDRVGSATNVTKFFVINFPRSQRISET